MAKKNKKSMFAGKVTANAHKQQTQGSQYGYLNIPKGVSLFKESPGKVKLDFIPYVVSDESHPDRDDDMEIATPGSPWYRRPFKIHRNVGPGMGEVVVCPTSKGQPCPICEYRANKMKKGTATKEELSELKPKDRNLYAVVPVGSKDYDKEIHLWDISQHLLQNMINEELEEDEEYGIFPDPEQGMTVRIRFKEKSIDGGNPFCEASRVDFIKRKEQYKSDIVEEAPNLDDALSVYDYETLKNLFLEIGDVDKGDEDEDFEDAEDEDIPTSVEDNGLDEEDVEEDEDEDDETEDEDVEEDDEDDFDDDDEDDDEEEDDIDDDEDDEEDDDEDDEDDEDEEDEEDDEEEESKRTKKSSKTKSKSKSKKKK